MNKYLILCSVLTFVALVVCDEEQQKTEGVTDAKLCSRSSSGDNDRGNYCSNCNQKCDLIPNVRTIGFSPWVYTNLSQNVVLACTPDSYFSQMVFNDYWLQNVTCNGAYNHVFSVYNDTIYTGSRTGRNGATVRVPLDVKDYQIVFGFNNGPFTWYERATVTSAECRGNTITTYSFWVPDDPLNGCCIPRGPNNPGISQFESTYYKLTIKGPANASNKCCSECYLLKGSTTYSNPVHN